MTIYQKKQDCTFDTFAWHSLLFSDDLQKSVYPEPHRFTIFQKIHKISLLTFSHPGDFVYPSPQRLTINQKKQDEAFDIFAWHSLSAVTIRSYLYQQQLQQQKQEQQQHHQQQQKLKIFAKDLCIFQLFQSTCAKDCCSSLLPLLSGILDLQCCNLSYIPQKKEKATFLATNW